MTKQPPDYDGLVHVRPDHLDSADLDETRLLCGRPLFDLGQGWPRLAVGRDEPTRVTCPDCRAALEAGTDRPGEFSPEFEEQLISVLTEAHEGMFGPEGDAALERSHARGLVDILRPLLLSADANARAHARREALRATEDVDGLPPGLQAALDAVAREAAASVPNTPPFDDWPKPRQARFKQSYLPVVLAATRAQARVIRGETD